MVPVEFCENMTKTSIGGLFFLGCAKVWEGDRCCVVKVWVRVRYMIVYNHLVCFEVVVLGVSDDGGWGLGTRGNGGEGVFFGGERCGSGGGIVGIFFFGAMVWEWEWGWGGKGVGGCWIHDCVCSPFVLEVVVLGVGEDGRLGFDDAGGMVLKGYFLEGSCVRGAEVWVGLDT